MLTWIGPLLGIASTALLLAALHHQQGKARQECAAFIIHYREQCLARFAYTAAEWAQFLRFERRRHRRSLRISAVTFLAIPVVALVVALVARDGVCSREYWYLPGALVACFVAIAFFQLVNEHYFRWAFHRGEVLFFQDGIVIGDVLICWLKYGVILRDIHQDENRRIIELELDILRGGPGTSSWDREVYRFPIPQAQLHTAVKMVGRLRPAVHPSQR